MADTSPYTQISQGHPNWRAIQRDLRAEGHEKAARRFQSTLVADHVAKDQKTQNLAHQFKDLDQSMGEFFASKVRDELHKQYPHDADVIVQAWLHRKKPEDLTIKRKKSRADQTEFSKQDTLEFMDPGSVTLARDRDEPYPPNPENSLLSLSDLPAPRRSNPMQFVQQLYEYFPQAWLTMLNELRNTGRK